MSETLVQKQHRFMCTFARFIAWLERHAEKKIGRAHV